MADVARSPEAEAAALRTVKYRLIAIFLLLPFVLVAAIVFDFVWEMNLSGRMTREYVLGIYGGLIAAFIAIFCGAGYLIRKRMRREEEELLKGPVPVEMKPNPAITPINMRSRN